MGNGTFLFANMLNNKQENLSPCHTQIKMEDKEKQIIKDLYKDMLEVGKLNHPDYYFMPKTFFNSIISRVQYLETELIRVKKARDKYKEKVKIKENKK